MELVSESDSDVHLSED